MHYFLPRDSKTAKNVFMKGYYYSFNEYLRERFKTRVRRISLNAGFTCPNRDGTLSDKGCVFCNEKGFANFPQADISLREQIIFSIEYFKKRFKAEKFIAYFQNASNTYASADILRGVYSQIEEFPEIVGLIISTRPDCVDEEKLSLIAGYADRYDVWIEYGLQTSHDKSLREMNRRHTFSRFVEAVEATAKKNIKAGAHLIIGLPGETASDMCQTAREIANLPISGVKLHVFHVLRDTKAQALYNSGKLSLLNAREYVQAACDFLEYLNPRCVIMRLVSNAREDVLIAPAWVNQKQKILADIDNEFKKRGTCQGFRWNK